MLDSEESRDEFEELYHSYKGMMYKIARHYTDNHHLAEEAMQNAFVAIARNFDTIKRLNQKQLESYLCKSTKNCAISVLRKEANALNKTIPLDNQLVGEDFPDVAESVADNELLDLIVDYIRAMKEEYADALTLHYLYGFSARQCALALDIPLSTAKSRIFHAKRLLKKRFKENIKW
ncbi:MAG: sigma-70 family RNA polymerase sigma factor [Clostridia bacterium]|nr:sigma-70 family RNA polymerase sigma factor [Clostridia bacterium]